MSLLRLIASQRFIAFPPVFLPTCSRSRRCGLNPRFPATRFTPLEEFRSSAAAPCHHGRCLLVVTAPSSLRRANRDSRSLSGSKHPTSAKKLCTSCQSARGRFAPASPPPLPVSGDGFSMLSRTQPPTRLCSADESVLSPSRCQLVRQPILPWALFPSKVLYTSLPSSFYRGWTDKLSLIGPGQSIAQRAGVRVASENPLSGSPELQIPQAGSGRCLRGMSEVHSRQGEPC